MAELPLTPRHGSTALCRECGKPVSYYEFTQWNGFEFDVLDAWWSHAEHPADCHEAAPGGTVGHVHVIPVDATLTADEAWRELCLMGVRATNTGRTKEWAVIKCDGEECQNIKDAS